MKRRLFTAAAVVSCLLGVGVAASWMRSYWIYDQLSCGSVSDRSRCTWKAFDAAFQFSGWPPRMPEGASGSVLTCFGKILLRQAVYSEKRLPGTGPRGYGWSSDDNVIPSFSYFYAVTSDMSRSGSWTVRQVTLRHWALMLFFAILPAAWLIAWRRRNSPHSSR